MGWMVRRIAVGVLVSAAAAASAQAAPLSPPVIRESFTLLPCSGAPGHRSTLQQEGCLEHQIVTRDHRIDALSKTIFGRLADGAARRRFVDGAHAWLRYRHLDCLSRSDAAEGGTLAALIDAQCTDAISAARIVELRDFAHDLEEA